MRRRASPTANGVPRAMLVMVYVSIISSPASLIQTSRGKPSTRVFTEGDIGRPWTSVQSSITASAAALAASVAALSAIFCI